MGQNPAVNHKIFGRWLSAFFILAAALNLSAQGTAFLYQGRLNDNGSPASGTYDLRFALYDAATNGNAISGPQTNFAVAVTVGLFTTNLDFGPVFTGTNYWLGIGVRTNGSPGAFTLLWPRQPLLPAPYAIFANTASNVLGTLAASQLTSGTLADARLTTNVSQLNRSQIFTGTNNFTNGANSFAGAFSGTFSGNGLLLTNLNATMLSTGTVADARLSTNVALLNRSSIFTATNNFTNEANSFSGTFFGNGLQLTNLNATLLATGTVADARLTTNVALLNRSSIFTATNNFTNGANSFSGTFFGNGLQLASLNATLVATGTLADARLTANVPLLNRDQAFTGANTFSNPTNNFTGNFFGNGLVGWVPVSGVSTQAMRDTGYLLLNSGLTTVTLPLSSALFMGDIVRVSGAGGGGWLVKANAGQSIRGNFASYGNSFLVGTPTFGDYRGVAVSADGIRLYAVSTGFQGVSTSADSGHTWNTPLIPAGFFQSVACSANGKKVFIAPTPAGIIQMSSDSGATWSATGTSGATVACTADGSQIFTGGIVCSGNGTYLGKLSAGSISISTNAGSTWIPVTGPVASVNCLAVSSDCARLVAGVNNGLLYASANLGATWTTINTTNLFWAGASMSGDGGKFAAAAFTSGGVSGGIYDYGVNAQPNITNVNSTISGSQGSAVELQYLGNNQFMPVSFSGLLWMN